MGHHDTQIRPDLEAAARKVPVCDPIPSRGERLSALLASGALGSRLIDAARAAALGHPSAPSPGDRR